MTLDTATLIPPPCPYCGSADTDPVVIAQPGGADTIAGWFCWTCYQEFESSASSAPSADQFQPRPTSRAAASKTRQKAQGPHP